MAICLHMETLQVKEVTRYKKIITNDEIRSYVNILFVRFMTCSVNIDLETFVIII